MIAELLTTGTEEALGGWVPPNLLAAALLAMFSVGLTVVGVAARALLKRLDKLESTVELATKEIGRLANFATREQVTQQITDSSSRLTAGLGNLGDRFDVRVAELRGEFTKLEIRVARIEERQERGTRARK